MLEQKTHIELKCDNEDCTVNFTWVDEDAAKEGFSLPDGAFRFVILAIPLGKEKWTFCSKYCLLDFMKNWVPRKSPREQLEEVEAKRKEIEEKEKQAAKIEAQLDDGDISRMVGEGGGDPTVSPVIEISRMATGKTSGLDPVTGLCEGPWDEFPG